MRVFISDFIFENAHKDMNVNLIRAIAKFADCDVLSVNGFYDDMKTEFEKLGVNIINYNLKIKKGKLGYRFNSYRLQRIANRVLKRENYDAMVSLCFETVSMAFMPLSFKNTTSFLFYHRNIDELTNSIKRLAFNTYKSRVYHIVFEDFFKERIVQDFDVPANRVFVIPHPVKKSSDICTDKYYDCVGLCNSNDENFIKEVVLQKDEFQKNNLHIILRSKGTQFKDNYVEIINEYMKKEDYDEYISSGRIIFVPLPKTYVYRLSGSIYDALSRKKTVCTTSKYYVEEYEKRFPGTCYYVDNCEQLISILKEKQELDISKSFDKFLEEHSLDTVSSLIHLMFTSVKDDC